MSDAARKFAALAALLALASVILGAFGAHALKSRLEPAMLTVFETGVRYQMYHALAVLAVALLMDRAPSRALSAAGWLFFAGIVFFSGSLYLLTTLHWRWLGPVTPLGGLCFMAGWLTLGIAMLRPQS
jgi:uncharacterized membrane protein YgdD (TMEM256/DUF423 family)